MKILLVRHAEPDYTIDSLTPKGRREAELLSRRLCKLDVKNFYVSPQGRARDTASYTLSKLNRTVEQRTPEGAFSEKIWSLDRRLYHPHYEE